jgi:putative PIN family toxin of toxin-antitoxin system
VRLYISTPILQEYSGVLRRPKFGFPARDVDELLALIRTVGVMIAPTHTLSRCPDETDNRFLECAEAAAAEYLVTGNQRHFPSRWKTTQIVSPRQFLERVVPPGT